MSPIDDPADSRAEAGPIRRLLLALDSSIPNRATLREAARLAQRLDAELTTLFVEDINLMNLAELPFVRHTSLLSGVAEHVDATIMEAMLRARAAEARRALEDIAAAGALRWSFRTVRGRIAEQVIAAAVDQDLLLIGWTTRSRDDTRFASLRIRKRPALGRAGSTVRSIAGGSRRPVLLLRDGSILDRPVVVVFDGSAGGTRALIAAASLARVVGQALVVLTIGPETLAEQARAALSGVPELTISHRPLRRPSVATVCAAQAESGGGIVVLDAESPLLAEDGDNPLSGFACPVLLAR